MVYKTINRLFATHKYITSIELYNGICSHLHIHSLWYYVSKDHRLDLAKNDVNIFFYIHTFIKIIR